MTLEILEIHHTVDATINTLSILFNCYLLYLIKYHSTFGVKLYQYMLTIDASLDLCLSVATLLAQPIPLTGNQHFVIVSNGYFADGSSTLDSFTLMLFCVFLYLNTMWIPIQFVYRYLLLCKENLKKANVLIAAIAIGHSALMLVLTVHFLEFRAELQPIGQNILELNEWPKSDITHKFLMVNPVADWRTILWLSSSSFSSFASIGIVVWCEKCILKNIKQMGKPTNANTQKMHKEFHFANYAEDALLAMAICPLITTAVPVFYFCFTIATGIYAGRVSVIMVIVLTSITIVNPLTTIVCFRCFRQVTTRCCISILTCGRYSSIASIAVSPIEAQSTSRGAMTNAIAQ